MSTIIDFPTKSVRTWRDIEQTLLEILDNSDAPDSFKERVISRVKECYQDYEFNYSFSINLQLPVDTYNKLSAQFQDFEKALKEHNHQLLANRIKLEIELAIAEGYM